MANLRKDPGPEIDPPPGEHHKDIKYRRQWLVFSHVDEKYDCDMYFVFLTRDNAPVTWGDGEVFYCDEVRGKETIDKFVERNSKKRRT